MRILQLAYKMPFSLKDGGDVSIYRSAQSLIAQPDCEVKLLTMNTLKDWFPEEEIPRDFAEKSSLEWVKVDNRLKPLKMLRNFFSSSRSDFIERFYTKEFKSKLLRILNEQKYDAVQLEHLCLGAYLDDIRTVFNGPIVLRAQNVESNLWETVRNQSKNSIARFYLKSAIRKLRSFEQRIIRDVDGVLALTEDDRTVFESFSPQTPIQTVPIGFDQNIATDYLFSKQYESAPVVYHLGSMDWHPNLQGVNWFLEEVIPILVQLQPDIPIRLAGKKMPKSMYDVGTKNIIVDGEVECATRFVEDKSILIVPLLSGSGIRVKIIEAMSLGKAIVSTSLGAQGINHTHGENILIADSTEEFAASISQLYANAELRRRLGQNAREFALQKFDLARIGQRKLDFYDTFITHTNANHHD
jgi:glycosyltransferase involved in cell wall biosynthesis